MTIYQVRDYEEMSRKAANIISAQVLIKPDCVLGLATGSTPLGTYNQLVEWYNKGDLDFSKVKTINLDEYKGLSGDDKQSYRYFMDENLFNLINIKSENTYLPNGKAEDDVQECIRYNQAIASLNEVDLQLLGLGHNGHIGFNEPGEVFRKETHCVKLSNCTIEANSRLFKAHEDVPRYAYTVGIKNILNARKILVIVSGKDKAEILYKSFFGEVTAEVPASVLQLHDNVILIADEEALSTVIKKGLI